MPDYARLIALASNEPNRAVLLSGSSTALLLTALGEGAENMYTWIGSGEFNSLTEAEKDSAKAIIALAEKEIMTGLTGVFFTEIIDRDGALLCDGAQYQRIDYPDLYEHWIGTSLIVDADNFNVPDFRDRFVVGASAGNPVLSTGGQATVTLTANEMPAHTHTEIGAVSAIINGGLEAPANSAVPLAGTTGSAGAGQAHDNIPPFLALRWYVWT